MSRVPRLVLEVLKSRATLRDSKPYLSMFTQRQPTPPVPRSAAQDRAVLHDKAQSMPDAPPLSLATDATSTADRTSRTVPSLDKTYTALVKLQGPFSDRQLGSIAEGLVYLQKLGLMCAIVLDHDSWPRSYPEALEDEDLLSYTSSSPETCRGLLEAGLRKRMVQELWRVADALTDAGASSWPHTDAVMCISSHPSNMHLVGDASLHNVYRALRGGHIPIIMPMALYEPPNEHTLRNVCVDANQVMVSLSREMSSENQTEDLTPLRLMVISREGGVPSHARNGHPHLMINLASEYESISASYIWNETHPAALSNLTMLRDCLAYMPHVASGLMASHRSPQSLVANLITNKAAYSPSLPPRLLAARREMRHMPTVVRAGMPVSVMTRWQDIDLGRVQKVLESSFHRKLDAPAYFARLEKCLDFMIVTGDYEGLAIVTREYAPDDLPHTEPIAYLDKFAILPSLQGSGAVDFLWNALRDEVHGLGLLDALNNNGGHNGIGQGRDLVWKSRAANKVNRWYFERSNGFMTLPGPPPHWYLFWCDAEDRLKRYAGEPIVSPGARLDDVWTNASETAPMLPIIVPEEQGRWDRWARCLQRIPSAWKA